MKDEDFHSNAPIDRDFIIYPTAKWYLNKYFLYIFQSPKSSTACRIFKYTTISTFCDIQVPKTL